jgi:excinuclease ABC subunit A
VIKTADWVIDLGPEGGHRGGRILAEGTPEHLATVAASHTGRFLAKMLTPDAVLPTKKAATPKASGLPPRASAAKKPAPAKKSRKSA